MIDINDLYNAIHEVRLCHYTDDNFKSIPIIILIRVSDINNFNKLSMDIKSSNNCDFHRYLTTDSNTWYNHVCLPYNFTGKNIPVNIAMVKEVSGFLADPSNLFNDNGKFMDSEMIRIVCFDYGYKKQVYEFSKVKGKIKEIKK